MSRIAKRHKKARLLIPLDVSIGLSVGGRRFLQADGFELPDMHAKVLLVVNHFTSQGCSSLVLQVEVRHIPALCGAGG